MQLCYWTMQILNTDCVNARAPVLLKMTEPESWRSRIQEKEPYIEELQAYGNQRWLNMDFFQEGQKVVVFHTQLVVFPVELRCEWQGPYTITKVFYDGALELHDQVNERVIKVGKHRARDYNVNEFGGLQSFTQIRMR